MSIQSPRAAAPLPPIVETTEHLQWLCASLAEAPWLAVDMEFVRDQSYYPQFCLIQLAVPDLAVCIDPLAIGDLTPLLDLLYRPQTVKVFHAARQDLEILFHLRGTVPENIVDTQIAGALLGLADQLGYAGLVSELLGVGLAKAQARTDWSLRPLSSAQLQYALDDVIYLAQCWPLIERRLDDLQRLPWLHEECRTLQDPALYRNPPELAWTRFGVADKLTGGQFAVLKALAAWREQEAQHSNAPRGWVLKDDLLLTLARAKPATLPQLREIRGISERTLKQHGATLATLIATAGAQPEPPPSRAYMSKTTQQEALLDVLTAVLRLTAEQHQLAAGLVAARKDLETLLRREADCRLLHGWRRALVGGELLALLDGETAISVRNGKLQIEADAPRGGGA